MSILFSALTIGLIVAGLFFILAIIPSTALPSEFIDSIVDVIGYIEPWGYLVNFSALLNVVIAVTVFEAIYFAIRVSIWVFDEIFNRP